MEGVLTSNGKESTERFIIKHTQLPGLVILQRKPLGDSRGYFERLFCEKELKPILGNRRIVQINHSLTEKKGTIRGLHYQKPPYAEMKLVTCIKGEVFDVAVDIRKSSPTFLKWHAEILTQDNFKTLVIPEGFAHGFQTLTDDCEIIYFVTNYYSPNLERGLYPLDPYVDINWPLKVNLMSIKDSAWPLINEVFDAIDLNLARIKP